MAAGVADRGWEAESGGPPHMRTRPGASGGTQLQMGASQTIFSGK